MLKGCKSKIHWAGEHTDIYHAWIIGALNSAARVVGEVLIQSGLKKEWYSIVDEFPPLQNWQGKVK